MYLEHLLELERSDDLSIVSTGDSLLLFAIHDLY